MCCCLWLFPHNQAAGICSGAGEKVTATWSALIKSGLQQTGLAGGGWRRFTEGKKERAGRITTDEINASTKLSKLAAVITDQRRESVDL